MIDKFPTHIDFLSDETKLKFIEEVAATKGSVKMGKYVYTKAKTKKGHFVTLPLEQIEKLLDNGVIKIKK